MDPRGCISHGVTARWSIEFLSSLYFGITIGTRLPWSPIDPYTCPRDHRPAGYFLSLSLAFSLSLSRANVLQHPRCNPCLELISGPRSNSKEITVGKKKARDWV